MRIVCFDDDDRVGVVVEERVHDITALTPDLLRQPPDTRINRLIEEWAAIRPKIDQLLSDPDTPSVALDTVRLRGANPAPPHVFALPANFRAHIGELKERVVTKPGRTAREQGFFLKAPASVVGAGDAILLPHGSARRFDHECELAVIIGRYARNVSRDHALDVVFGYSCLIDVTMRIEAGRFEEERSMRKSFATFTPLGPSIVTADEIDDIGSRTGRLWVNGELRQSAPLEGMIVDVAEAIELVSSVLPLQPGDVIAMGTPAGVGEIRPGDTVRIAIGGIGDMSLPVHEAPAASPRAY